MIAVGLAFAVVIRIGDIEQAIVESSFGGDGAVRELCDLLMVANGRYAGLLAPYCA